MKTCRIINERFSWILEVDGMKIEFQDRVAAEYFHQHYKGLGYEVEFIDQKRR